MSPFQRVPGNPLNTMLKREILLSQPPEMFAPLFNGRNPTLQERVHCIEVALQRTNCHNVWENDTYTVKINHHPPFIHLGISRHDGQACNNWHDLQQIKNELVGSECEGVELLPAESRLVDTANQYHVWVHADPSYRFPFGFTQRFVLEEPIGMPVAVRAFNSDGHTSRTSAPAAA
jgi:hypothetical protein